MSGKKDKDAKRASTVGRRDFLAGVAVAGAAGAMGGSAKAAVADNAPKARSALPPNAIQLAAETQPPPPARVAGPGRPGSDFMLDVIKTLDIPYIATNPSSGCRGLHESIINYGDNKMPELLTVTHEEIGAAMGHGYFKVAGKPLGLLCHGTVGLQHASMAIYNAWCDRVPVIVLVGNFADASQRSPGVGAIHTAQDPGMLVRDFTKWDDNPASLQHFAESMVRAYKVAMTPPYEPVLLALDISLQEEPIPSGRTLSIPKLTIPAPPQGDPGAVREAARLLAQAERPVIVVGRSARTPDGITRLIALAETLNAPVLTQLERMCIPNTHYLYRNGDPALGGGGVADADVILGIELGDFFGTVNRVPDIEGRPTEPRIKPGTKLISIGVSDLYLRANYQDFQRYQPVDVAIAGDGEATLPALTEAVRRELSGSRRSAVEARGQKARDAFAAEQKKDTEAAAIGWNSSPVSTGRLCAEIWDQIRHREWSLLSGTIFQMNWPHRLWKFEKHHQYIGSSGGAGVGYGAPAALGAALAFRDQGGGVVPVNIQADGDLMYGPGTLWSAVHHNIPLFSIMHNNRGYHQEVMHVGRISALRQRSVERAHIGNSLGNPNIDFAALAKSMGMEGIGPIDNPADLAPAIKRGLEVFDAGEPVLIDVVSQPR